MQQGAQRSSLDEQITSKCTTDEPVKVVESFKSNCSPYECFSPCFIISNLIEHLYTLVVNTFCFSTLHKRVDLILMNFLLEPPAITCACLICFSAALKRSGLIPLLYIVYTRSYLGGHRHRLDITFAYGIDSARVFYMFSQCNGDRSTLNSSETAAFLELLIYLKISLAFFFYLIVGEYHVLDRRNI